MSDLSIFAKRLNEAREKAGLTQEQLAKKAGLTKASISSYENQSEKSKKPSLDKVMDIAKTLNVSIDWLCGFDNDKISVTDFSAETYLRSLVIAISEKTCEVRLTAIDEVIVHFKSEILSYYLKRVNDLINVYRERSLTKDLYETCIDKLISDHKKYCIFCYNFLTKEEAAYAEKELVEMFKTRPGNYELVNLDVSSQNGTLEKMVQLFLSEEYNETLRSKTDNLN